MMVFGNVFGFWGVVLAAPLVATLKIFVLQYTANREAETLKPPEGRHPKARPPSLPPGTPGSRLRHHRQ